MCVKVSHLRKELKANITLPDNCFYVGKEFLNLEISPFYLELNPIEYESWIWQQIKNKTNIYQKLLVIINLVILGDNITLACSCDKSADCNALTLKKVVCYLAEQEKLFRQTNDLPNEKQRHFVINAIIDHREVPIEILSKYPDVLAAQKAVQALYNNDDVTAYELLKVLNYKHLEQASHLIGLPVGLTKSRKELLGKVKDLLPKSTIKAIQQLVQTKKHI